jgi:hypothetical protein
VADFFTSLATRALGVATDLILPAVPGRFEAGPDVLEEPGAALPEAIEARVGAVSGGVRSAGRESPPLRADDAAHALRSATADTSDHSTPSHVDESATGRDTNDTPHQPTTPTDNTAPAHHTNNPPHEPTTTPDDGATACNTNNAPHQPITPPDDDAPPHPNDHAAHQPTTPPDDAAPARNSDDGTQQSATPHTNEAATARRRDDAADRSTKPYRNGAAVLDDGDRPAATPHADPEATVPAVTDDAHETTSLHPGGPKMQRRGDDDTQDPPTSDTQPLPRRRGDEATPSTDAPPPVRLGRSAIPQREPATLGADETTRLSAGDAAPTVREDDAHEPTPLRAEPPETLLRSDHNTEAGTLPADGADAGPRNADAAKLRRRDDGDGGATTLHSAEESARGQDGERTAAELSEGGAVRPSKPDATTFPAEAPVRSGERSAAAGEWLRSTNDTAQAVRRNGRDAPRLRADDATTPADDGERDGSERGWRMPGAEQVAHDAAAPPSGGDSDARERQAAMARAEDERRADDATAPRGTPGERRAAPGHSGEVDTIDREVAAPRGRTDDAATAGGGERQAAISHAPQMTPPADDAGAPARNGERHPAVPRAEAATLRANQATTAGGGERQTAIPHPQRITPPANDAAAPATSGDRRAAVPRAEAATQRAVDAAKGERTAVLRADAARRRAEDATVVGGGDARHAGTGRGGDRERTQREAAMARAAAPADRGGERQRNQREAADDRGGEPQRKEREAAVPPVGEAKPESSGARDGSERAAVAARAADGEVTPERGRALEAAERATRAGDAAGAERDVQPVQARKVAPRSQPVPQRARSLDDRRPKVTVEIGVVEVVEDHVADQVRSPATLPVTLDAYLRRRR